MRRHFLILRLLTGYGGPICNVNNESFWVAALRSLSQEFSNHGCVAGFVRFHPLLEIIENSIV